MLTILIFYIVESKKYENLGKLHDDKFFSSVDF